MSSVQYNQAFSPRVPASGYPFPFSVFRVIKFLAVAGFIFALPAMLRAQSNPPFSNPALDSFCYFPQIGVPGEIDTIYGDSAGQGLGAYIHNLGPKPDGTPGNMLIGSGYDVPFVNWNEVPTGPTFNLHNLRAVAQTLNINPQYLHFGHFHDRSHVDLFDDLNWIIYWADDNGNYDASRTTTLIPNLTRDGTTHWSSDGGDVFTYLAPMASDTIDDIVVGLYIVPSFPPNPTLDTLFLLYFKGGSNLWSDTIKTQDSIVYLGQASPSYGVFNVISGDFRGNGRQDLLIFDEKDNLYFFRNDSPFSLQGLANAVRFDTIWPLAPKPGLFAMPLFPKKVVDHSVDLLMDIPDSAGTNTLRTLYLFRGGPDFGSHRITIDSAAYVITPPSLGYAEWPEVLIDAGDMTGTGNHVLYTYGWDNGYGWQNYYVTGQALDNKIDMYYNGIVVLGDTLTANADSLEDLLAGDDVFQSDYDATNGIGGAGTMWVIYGSKNIPVHLNPQFADVVNIPQVNGAGISFAPNPITQSWSVATIVWPEAEDAEYEVYNILGSIVEKGTVRMLGGAEQQRIYFPNLPDGTYVFVIHGQSHEAQAKITIMR